MTDYSQLFISENPATAAFRKAEEFKQKQQTGELTNESTRLANDFSRQTNPVRFRTLTAEASKAETGAQVAKDEAPFAGPIKAATLHQHNAQAVGTEMTNLGKVLDHIEKTGDVEGGKSMLKQFGMSLPPQALDNAELRGAMRGYYDAGKTFYSNRPSDWHQYMQKGLTEMAERKKQGQPLNDPRAPYQVQGAPMPPSSTGKWGRIGTDANGDPIMGYPDSAPPSAAPAQPSPPAPAAPGTAPGASLPTAPGTQTATGAQPTGPQPGAVPPVPPAPAVGSQSSVPGPTGTRLGTTVAGPPTASIGDPAAAPSAGVVSDVPLTAGVPPGAPPAQPTQPAPPTANVAAGSARMSPAAINAAAEQFILTGHLPSERRGKWARSETAAIRNRASELMQERGIKPEDQPKQWQQFGAEKVAIQRFMSGPRGNTVRSLGVVVDHLGTMRELALALQNGNIQAFNSLGNAFAMKTGQPAPTNAATAAQIVGSEVIKALGIAGAGTKEERQEAANAFSTARSPEQLMQAIDKVVKPLMIGQLTGLRRQFRVSTGLDESKFDAMLGEEAKGFLAAPGEHGPGGAPPPGAPTNAKQAPDGNWYVSDPKRPGKYLQFVQ